MVVYLVIIEESYGSHTVDVYGSREDAVKFASTVANGMDAKDSTESDRKDAYAVVVSFVRESECSWTTISVEEREVKVEETVEDPAFRATYFPECTKTHVEFDLVEDFGDCAEVRCKRCGAVFEIDCDTNTDVDSETGDRITVCPKCGALGN